MLVCFALMLSAGLADLPALAAEVETEARALTTETEVSPAFLAGIEDLSSDAAKLSAGLREAGIEQDLPLIFQGIAEDARARAEALRAADTQAERDAALTELRMLLDDTILIAPMAASAAADRAAERDLAAR